METQHRDPADPVARLVEELRERLDVLRPSYEEYLRVRKAINSAERSFPRGPYAKRKLTHRQAVRWAFQAIDVPEGRSALEIRNWLEAQGHDMPRETVHKEINFLHAEGFITRMPKTYPRRFRLRRPVA
jgi:hypothetical protein